MSSSDSPFPLLVKKAFQHTRKDNRVKKYDAKIVVIGTGGGGCNTVTHLMRIGITGATCIACNTDSQHLEISEAHYKLLLGPKTTNGLGAGGYPEVGQAAAEESREEIRKLLEGADLVFVTAGMGGGTGTGSAPVIAQIAKDEIGAIVVGVVTMPFSIEKSRVTKAREGLNKLREFTDTVVVVENDKLLELAGDAPLEEAFAIADEVLAQMVKGITETIKVPSLVNLDFADVKAVLQGGGVAMVGIGEAKGKPSEERANMAVENALSRPLLEVDISGARGALIHVTGGRDMTLQEAHMVPKLISERLDPNANVIWGARIDPEFDGYLRVILIVTGVQSPNILGPIRVSSQSRIGIKEPRDTDDDKYQIPGVDHIG
ncbi:MAG: cell division protein FtsZ [Candidatus Asgardarchaeia archaeon]